MDIDAFLARNQPAWQRLAELTARGRRGRRLSADEVAELVELYQRVSSHLAHARAAFDEPALTARLTTLVAAANGVVHGSRSSSLTALGRFFTTTFPLAVWQVRGAVAVSAALLLLPALVVGWWLAVSPAAVEASAPEAVREAYLARDFEAYYSSDPAAQFAAEVTFNNIRVAVLAFAVGIAGGVGTAAVLAYNGALVGQAGGLFHAAGEAPRFWGLILPHGLLELSAVVVAGGAGLALGWALISPGDRPRRVALAEAGRRTIVIVLGVTLAFVVAGLIEGFVTGSGLPTVVRVGVGAIAFAVFWWWVLGRGREAEWRQQHADDPDEGAGSLRRPPQKVGDAT